MTCDLLHMRGLAGYKSGEERGRAVWGRNRVDEQHILARLNLLRIEHRDLDSAIAALSDGVPDQLQLARLKKRKLKLRDEISTLEDYLLPDSIA
jgi:hypothetical protein